MSTGYQSNNQRIAKNTLYMYLRMMISLLVSLFTTRIIFHTLGVDNFGIYNIVGSVIVFFTFLNNGLVNATRRYFTAELAKGDYKSQNNVFNLSLISHAIVSLSILVLAETVGLWAVNNLLNIPADRIFAANMVFQASILTVLIQVMQAPYMAAITAHERMSIYAYFSIFDVFIKLLLVISLVYVPGDALIVYGWLLSIVAILNFLLYSLYCNLSFAECHAKRPHNMSLLKEIFKFMGWNLVGQGTVIITNQGVTILVNKFFSVAANAAMGVSNQITHIVTNFVTNFQTAFHPQITKLYVTDQFDELERLATRCSRFSLYMVLIFTLPIICQIENFLHLWLGNYPEFAVEFCIYTLIGMCIDSVSAPLWMILGSDKRIKKYQIIISIIYMFSFILGWLFLSLNMPPYSVIFARMIVYISSLFARLLLVKEKVSVFRVRYWLSSVIFDTLKILIIPILLICVLKTTSFDNRYYELFACGGLSLIATLTSIYFLGMDAKERVFIITKILKLKK